MSEKQVVGIDPSMVATAVAWCDGGVTLVRPRKKPTEDRIKRITLIAERVTTGLLQHHESPTMADIDLVVIEGYSYGSPYRGELMGELGGVLRYVIAQAGYPWIEVAPTTLKKYATGSGMSKKAGMVIAARDRLGYDGDDDNEADALWLRAYGHALLGDPLVDLPISHITALLRKDS